MTSKEEQLELGKLELQTDFRVVHIENIQICEQVNEHGVMTVRFLTEDKVESNDVVRYQGSKVLLKVKEEETIFCGICRKIHLISQNQYAEIELTADTLSIETDKEKCTKVFQDKSKTFGKVMSQGIGKKNHNFLDYESGLKNKKVEEILSQKDETDWEFDRRIANRYQKLLFVNSKDEGGKVHIGNIPFRILEPGIILDQYIVRDVDKARKLQGNSIPKASVFEYENVVLTVSNLAIGVGYGVKWDNRTQIVVKSTITCKDQLLQNEITLANAEGLTPSEEQIIEAASFSRVLEGTVQAVKKNYVQVAFENEDNKPQWIPYVHTAGNYFYTMPDVGDKVSVYYEAVKGEKDSARVICTQSHHENDSPDFKRYQDKMFTGNNRMIKFGGKTLELIGDRKKYDGKKGKKTHIILDDDYGIEIYSANDISLSTSKGGNILIQAVDKGFKGLDKAKQAFERTHAIGNTRFVASGGGLPDTGALVNTKAISFSALKKAVKDNVESPFQLVDNVQKLMGDIGGSTGTEAHEKDKKGYQEGVVDIFAAKKLVLNVGNSSIIFSKGVIQIKANKFRQIGTDHSILPDLGGLMDMTLDLSALADNVSGALPADGSSPGIDAIGMVPRQREKPITARAAAKKAKKYQSGASGQKTDVPTITAVDGDFEISDEESKKDAASVSGGVSTQDARYEEKPQEVNKDTSTTQKEQGKKPDKNKDKITENQSTTALNGDPIDMVTGSYLVDQCDFIINDISGIYAVERTYESVLSQKDSPVGRGWTLSLFSTAYIYDDRVEIVLSDNRTEIFLKTEDGFRNRKGGTKRLALYAQEDGYLMREATTGISRLYDRDGKILQEIDHNGNRRLYQYTGCTLRRISFASGQYLDFTWQGSHITSIQDCIGRKVHYRYENSLLTEVETVTGGVERYTYDQDGRITNVTNADGVTYVHNEYDQKGRVVRQTLCNGQEYILLYNDDDRTNIYLTPGSNRQICYIYNRNRQLVCTKYQDGTTQERKYDDWENIIWEKDRNGNETHRTYDEFGHLLEEEYPNGLIVSYIYDEDGNCLHMWDNNGTDISYHYDKNGNITKEIEQLDGSVSRSVTFEYDRYGRVEAFTDANGHKETYLYESGFWESTTFTTAAGSVYRHNLDRAGRCVAVTSADGESTYAYNSLDIMCMATNPMGHTTRYLYNRMADLIGLVRPNHHVHGEPDIAKETYTNDAFHQRLSRTDCTGAVYAVHRDGEGNIIKEINPNTYNRETGDGEGIVYLYDDYDQAVRVCYPGGGILRRWYDPAGNVIKICSPTQYDKIADNGAGYTYEYDSMGRIVQETAPDGTVLWRYVYDLRGNILKIISAKGMATGSTDEERTGSLYTYNRLGWLMESRIPVSIQDNEIQYRLTKYKYDKAGNRIQERRFCEYQTKDSEGGIVHTINYTYDADDRLIQVSDCTGAVIEYRYDANNRRIFEKRRINDSAEQIFRYHYDAGGRLIELNRTADKEGCGRGSVSVKYEYDKNGNNIKMILPTGAQILREYDVADRLISERHIDKDCGIDNTTRFAYDKAGNLVSITDNQGRSTQIAYDLMNQEIKRTERDGSVTRQFYDAEGQLIKVIRPNEYQRAGDNGKGLQYTYDARGNILTVVRPDGIIQESNLYDIEGNLIHTHNGTGNGVDIEYDIGGRRTKIMTKGKASQQYVYDAPGNITGITDGAGNHTEYILDKWGRIVEIRQADESSEFYGYDYAGNVIRSTDGEGNTTTYEYSNINQLAVLTDPTGEQETYHYDAQERLCKVTDRNGTQTRYTYNIYDNLTERTAKKTDGTELSDRYEYTTEGLLKSAIAQGMRYNYVYDILGRLTEKKASGRTLLSFQYDRNGNLTHQIDVTGKVTEYRYDLTDSIRQVWDNDKKIAEYSYNPDNTINSLSCGSLYTEYTYDTDRNLIGLKTKFGTEVIVENKYTYDGNGNQLEKLQKHGTIKYNYDRMNRLEKVQYPNATEELFYDKAGNRTKRLYNGAEELYQYDRRNRLTTYTKGGVTSQFTYDKAGNLLKDDKAKYTYDAFNRNTKVETFNGNIQINRYDAEDLRHEMEENGKLVTFIFRGDEIVTEETQEDKIRYIRTNSLLASDAESARTYYHYASDEMGSITHVVDSEANKILNRYEYDAWGNLTTCDEKVPNRFKFNGQQYDPITQQYYLRARYYNPVIGRFTQEDTYRGDGLNLYAYCAGNPVYYVDPSGHICRKTADRVLQQLSEDEQGRELLKKYQKQIEDALSYQIRAQRKKKSFEQSPYTKKTIAHDGKNYTMSGWTKNRFNKKALKLFRRDYLDINGNKRDIIQEILYDFELLESQGIFTPTEDRANDQGVPYQYNASHAEKQVAMINGRNVIGVSKNMCEDCQDYFWAKAKLNNESKIIADPSGIHIFTQDGKQINIMYGKKTIRIVEGVINPNNLEILRLR